MMNTFIIKTLKLNLYMMVYKLWFMISKIYFKNYFSIIISRSGFDPGPIYTVINSMDWLWRQTGILDFENEFESSMSTIWNVLRTTHLSNTFEIYSNPLCNFQVPSSTKNYHEKLLDKIPKYFEIQGSVIYGQPSIVCITSPKEQILIIFTLWWRYSLGKAVKESRKNREGKGRQSGKGRQKGG